MQEADRPAAWYNWRNMNCGDIAPDEEDGEGLGADDEGVDPGDELNVTALGLGKGCGSASGAELS